MNACQRQTILSSEWLNLQAGLRMALDRLSLISGIYRQQWDRHSSATASGSDGLQCDRDPLANADTHRGEGLLSGFQFQHGRAGDPGP